MASFKTRAFGPIFMSFIKTLILILLINCCATNYAYANSVAFSKAQLVKVKTQNIGKQWLMLLWSVDCPPCFKELAILQKLQSKYNDLPVVIINTDADDELTEEREAVIKNFELNHFTNLHFVDGKADQSRFLVDPQWYGELPRSYFVAKDGKFHGKSGLVDKTMLTQWLLF